MTQIVSLCARFSCAALLLLLWQGCTKENEEDASVTEEALSGTWRVEAFRYGQDSTNPRAWNPYDYGRKTTINELYCVYDRRVNESFVSLINCAYDITPYSSVGVPSSDCARSVFMRDTVWYEQTKYDLVLGGAGQCNWIEEYRGSGSVNRFNQPCSPLRYLPGGTQQQERPCKWSVDAAAKILTVDYSPGFSSMGTGHFDRFQVLALSNTSLTIKLIGNSGNEYRLKKI